MPIKPRLLAAIIAGLGGTPAVQPLRIVTALNHFPNSSESRGVIGKADRWAHVVGSGAVTSLVPNFSACLTSAVGPNTVISDNDLPITEGSVEYDGVSVPMTFSGSRTKLLVQGSNDVLADEIPATAFGVSEFPVGAVIWTKTKILLTGTTQKVPASTGARISGDVSGQQSWWYDPLATTVSNVDTLGAFTSTGTTPQARSGGFCPFMVGRFKAGNPIVGYATGDSITQGTGDGTANSTGTGRGWFAMLNKTLLNNTFTASMNVACHGSGNLLGTRPQLLAYAKYCYGWANVFYGTNDFGTVGTAVSVATENTSITNLINLIRAAGTFNKVSVCKLLVRNTSTDAWATEANQTPFAGWSNTGTSNPFVWNAGLPAAVGADFVIPFNSIRGTDPVKWVSNGVANYAAFDDTHPSNGGGNLMAAEAQPIVRTALGI